MELKRIAIKAIPITIGSAILGASAFFPLGDWRILLTVVIGSVVMMTGGFIANPPKPRSLGSDPHALASAYVCGKHNIGHVQLMEIINGQRTDVDSDKILKDYNLTYRQFQTRLNFGAQVTQ